MSYIKKWAHIFIMAGKKRGPRKGERFEEGHAHAFGKSLFKLRRRRGLTQAALAEKMGTTVRMVSHWEREVSKPYADLLPRLARALEVPETAFLSPKAAEEAQKEMRPVSRALMKRLELVKELSPKSQKAIQQFIDTLARAERQTLQ